MRVAIIGSGYVGLVAAACLAEIGHHVICVDNDNSKVEALQRGECIIHEEFLPELLARHGNERLTFSTDLPAAVRKSSVVFIAVGTPPADSGEADLSILESVCREIAPEIDNFKVVVVKSTVPVRTNQWIRRMMVRYGAPQGNFEVASNPEFLREGTAVTDFLYGDRIVIGSDSKRCTAMLQQVYVPLTSGKYARSRNAIPSPDCAIVPTRLIVTSAKSAELIKHASNAFLAMKISFINAVANICESVGADVQEVCTGMGTDERIGGRFLRPGIGYGGSCFPKDLRAFRSVAYDCGYEFRLLDEVIRINEEQRRQFLRKVRSALWTLRGKKLGVLGLAFKGGTDDLRESPAVALIKMLRAQGCEISAYDPAAMERAKQELPQGLVSYATDAYHAASDADALLILTDWEEFASLDFERLRASMRYPIIIDGRNMYSPSEMAEAGFSYFSVGRPEAFPQMQTNTATNVVPDTMADQAEEAA